MGTGRLLVLIDFDHAAHGPRELDLLFAAPDHFHEPAADRDAFTRAYGRNLLTWLPPQNSPVDCTPCGELRIVRSGPVLDSQPSSWPMLRS